MRFPSGLYKALAFSFIKKGLSGRRKSPLVLMLEPTLRCNLSCAGCDRIRLAGTREVEDLPLHECVAAAVESGAPVVTVTGGEPLLYKDLKPLLSELLRLKRYVYLCSNGILCESFVEDFEPHPAFTLNIHLDGMEKSHDRITGRAGMFNKALEAIRRAKEKGFRVCTNTSVYKEQRCGRAGTALCDPQRAQPGWDTHLPGLQLRERGERYIHGERRDAATLQRDGEPLRSVCLHEHANVYRIPSGEKGDVVYAMG